MDRINIKFFNGVATTFHERRSFIDNIIFPFTDYIVIQTLLAEGRFIRKIAEIFGFPKATIFNETHRLLGLYNAEKAEKHHRKKLSNVGRRMSLMSVMKQLIEEKIIVKKWSPGEVAHVIGIAHKSIYNWIDLWAIKSCDLSDRGIHRHRVKKTGDT